jgi:NAD(P)-dependent dehydrogenase (short-subunit alcohol dehydrogenase family)
MRTRTEPGAAVFAGKVAIVTGGTSGIGAACVEDLVGHGASVVFAGRRREEGRAIEAKLGELATFIRADVSQEDSVRALIDATMSKYDRIDFLVNNAGHSLGIQSILDFDVEQFDRLVSVHLRGTLLGIKHAGTHMIARGGGAIVNMASISGHMAGISGHTYSTLKAAVLQLTRSVALELGPRGVRVNSVSPGAIVTGIFGKAAGMTEAEAEGTLAPLAARFAGLQSIPRAGTPADVARVVTWLLSDEAAFVNGADIKVDGAMPGGMAWAKLTEMRTGLAKPTP